ncbi:hypothetical protein GCM10027417_24980 [Glutamicibacter endophyticus]
MTDFPAPRPTLRPHVRIDAGNPTARGQQRAAQLGDQLHGALAIYTKFFDLAGLTQQQVRSDAERALEDISNFAPELAEEITGTATEANLSPWQVATLNARTEILARSANIAPGECSTIVRETPHGTFGVQTWDWHVELAGHWHTQQVIGGRHHMVGITEHGILGKIGINSAGLGLHFNILGHREDAVGGIPMHVLSAYVLQNAGSVAEAIDVVRSAPIASSGSFALLDRQGSALLEITPRGVFEVPPLQAGTHLRTNHFLTETPKAEEKSWLYQPDSDQRFDFLAARLANGAPDSVDELFEQLVTGSGEPPVTCVPDMNLSMGQRWASLATVILDPSARSAKVLDGTPAEAGQRPWHTLIAN